MSKLPEYGKPQFSRVVSDLWGELDDLAKQELVLLLVEGYEELEQIIAAEQLVLASQNGHGLVPILWEEALEGPLGALGDARDELWEYQNA